MKPTQTAAVTDTTICDTMFCPARTDLLTTRVNGERIDLAPCDGFSGPCFDHRFEAQLRLIEERAKAKPRRAGGVAALPHALPLSASSAKRGIHPQQNAACPKNLCPT
jgi:hypothetical protein